MIWNRSAVWSLTLIPMVLAVLATTFYILPLLTGISKNELNLAGQWDSCIANNNLTIKNIATDCEWKQIYLPNSHITPATTHNKIFFRRTFETPTYCQDRSLSCVLIVAGYHNILRVNINGHDLGATGTISDLYPANFLLPADIFVKSNSPNLMVLELSTIQPRSRPGISMEPLGIVPQGRGLRISGAIIAERIGLPLMAGFGCIILCVLAGFWQFSTSLSRTTVKYYFLYCLSSGVSLLFYSCIPREVLPYSFSINLHFIFRFLMELMLLHLVASFFNVQNYLITFTKFVLKAGLVALFIFSAISLTKYEPIISSPLDFVIMPSLTNLIGFRGNSIIRILAALLLPFSIISKAIAFYCSVQSRRFFREISILVLIFFIVLILQTIDLATFWGFININAERYSTRLYIPFIALSFGYVLFIDLTRREHFLFRSSQVGLVAASAAHDVRAPLGTLRVLHRQLDKISEDERDLLKLAIDSLEGISFQLLNLFKYGLTPPLKLDYKTHILDAVVEIVMTTNWSASSKEKPISLITFPENIGLGSYVDKQEFKRALQNLINNAIEANLGKRNPISVRISGVTDRVLIDVIDHGNGIDPETIRQFNNHRFGHSAKVHGHGLGLQQVWEFVQRYNGDLQFSSSAAIGTTVTLILPAILAPEPICRPIKLSNYSEIVTLGVDQSIQSLLKSSCSNITEFFHFDQGSLFNKYLEKPSSLKRLFFISGPFISDHIFLSAILLSFQNIPNDLIIICPTLDLDTSKFIHNKNIKYTSKGLLAYIMFQ